MTRVNSSSLAGPALPKVFMAVPMPAQLTSTLMPPTATAARSRAPATSSALVTSAGAKTAAGPSALATSAPAEAGRSSSATRAPAATKRAAVARPSPEAPPVTTALTELSSMRDPPDRRILADAPALCSPPGCDRRAIGGRIRYACPDFMRTSYRPTHQRRILCVYPQYARSFGTFQHAYAFFGGRVRAFMPPQGLLVVAAYLPETWAVRFVDENSRPATPADFDWADAVFVSGMHIQRAQIYDVIARAHAHDRPAIVGGPSVSGCPEYYPDADMLHVGEIGDATDRLIEHLDRTPGRPASQLRFETKERLAAGRLSHAGLRDDSAARVLHRQHPVLQRLPVRVRVLRHPRPLRAQPPAEDGRAGAARARPHRGGGRAPASTSSTTTSSATRRPRWSCCPTWSSGRRRNKLPAALRLRGDPQHRQERAGAGADARGGLHHGLLRDRDAGAGAPCTRCPRTRTCACRSWKRSSGSTATASRWCPASSSGSTPTGPTPPIGSSSSSTPPVSPC